MPDKHSNNAFDLLNSEFSNFDLEQENARHLQNLRRRQAAQQHSQDFTDDSDDFEEESDSRGRGCVGTALRLLLILLLAAALAWLVFMPDGSLKELWDKITPGFGSAASWVAGLFGGSDDRITAGVGDASSAPAGSSDADGESLPDGQEELPEDENGQTPDDVSADQTALPESDSPYRITVYRPSQIVIVYDAAGSPAKIFSCSSGKSSTPTRLGEYAIRAKYRWRFMVGNCYTQYASSFSSGYLFHSIPYNRKNAGTMSNASYDKLGNPASSGCIRLCFRDTKWIYDNCPIGTHVNVVDEKAPAGSVPEIIPERIKDDAHSGWDPTDDAPDNPYNR